jgi:Tol biopolymer transport system component
VRYDPKSRQATSLLPGVCISSHVYSPDGQWIACVSAGGAILRMKPDGRERLVLADASLSGFDLKWSPDGEQIAFNSPTEGGRGAVFLVPLAGGAPRQLLPEGIAQTDASWSPDGQLLAFARAKDDSSSFSIWVLNLRTNQFSRVPGSEGMRCPAWSPDGRFLAAATEDGHKVMLYDFRTQQWTQLAQATVLNDDAMIWSPDGKFLYVQDILGKNEAVNRIRIDNRKTEVVASFETLLRNGVQRVALSGFAPDGTFVVNVDRGGSDIYALDLDLP